LSGHPRSAAFISRNGAPAAGTEPFSSTVDAVTDRAGAGNYDEARLAVSSSIQSDFRIADNLDFADS
jgi:hypothetical protein